MAGVTTPAFRALCRSFGGGLFVSEMVSARGLVEGGRGSWDLLRFGADEHPRSAQLSGADPVVVGEAVRRLVGDGVVDHIDLNVGCPMPKITRHGGGSALPARPARFAAVVRAAVAAAGEVPVTVKMRVGLDADRPTHLVAGRICAAEGVAAVAVHARTAAQRYAGSADWTAIAALRATVASIPVLGNGDIWEAGDALAMVRSTGCDGVVIGRGCLGRPWLFGQLADVFGGRSPRPEPTLGEALVVLRRHADGLCAELGERRAMSEMRRHADWLLAGYDVPPGTIERARRLAAAADLDALAGDVDLTAPARPGAGRLLRGPTAGPGPVALPDGWLDGDDDRPLSPLADAAVSGG
jgi:nifR3 family TIM-barrel protein